MSPFGGVAGALNVPSALFSDSASRIPKSDPMEGRLQVRLSWSRCISFDLLQTNCKISTNKNEQLLGHAALQHGTNSRPGSWHTRGLSEGSRTPFRSQYRTEALCKVGSIFSVEEEIFIEEEQIFIEKDSSTWSLSSIIARYVLGLSQGTVSELLSKPKSWDKLTEKGRDSYRKMHAWCHDDQVTSLFESLMKMRSMKIFLLQAIMLLKTLIPRKGELVRPVSSASMVVKCE